MKIRLLPRQINYECLVGQDLYEGAFRAGIRIPVSCRNGVCEYCEGVLRAGRCKDRRSGQEYRQPGEKVLLCNVIPLTDCEVEMANVLDRGEWPVLSVSCQLVSVEALSHEVFRVLLRLPAGKKVGFSPGQYLAVELPEREPAFFSIASAPSAAAGTQRLIELHIQASPDWGSAWQILTHMRTHSSVRVSLPRGRACLAEPPQQPLLLIVAGTGFAQAKSVIEYLHEQQHQRPVYLYWGVRKSEDLYWRELPQQWAAHAGLRYTEVVSDSDENAWSGHHEPLYQRVLQDGHELVQCQVLASGSPAMVYATLDALVEAGLNAQNFHSDVFEYAPRT